MESIKKARPPEHYRRWRRTEIEEALSLREKGWEWDRIAQRLNRASGKTVQRTISNFQKGRLSLWIEETERKRDLYLQEALAGLSFGEIARRHGQHKSVVWTMLARIGYDQETIQEERELRSEAVSGHARPHSGQRAA